MKNNSMLLLFDRKVRTKGLFIVIGLIWTLLFSGIPAPLDKTSGEKRPNIILIMADDMGYETVGSYGSADYQTPQLDYLAKTGMRFKHAYSTPLCTPTRVKIMTGQYNFRNYTGFGKLRQGEYTFGHLAKEAGYKTFIAGKWQLAGGHSNPENHPYQAGFDEYCLWRLIPGNYWDRYKNPTIMKNGELMQNVESKYGPDIITHSVLHFIDRHESDPFFVYYPMILPHSPFQPTPDHEKFDDFKIEGFSKNLYFDDMVHYIDKLVGMIIRKLDEKGLRENTLIIFTTDNGTYKGIESSMKNGDTIVGGKGLPIETGTHVPLIVNWKGKVKPGSINSNLIDFSDFFPTLAEAMNIPVPDKVQTDGISFYNQLVGGVGPSRDWVFCHYHAGKERFPPAVYVHDKTWKLYESGGFYNIHKDPGENHILNDNALSQKAKEAKREFRLILDSLQREEERLKRD